MLFTYYRRFFSEVVIPPAVAAELRHPNTPESISTWINSNPPWLRIEAPRVIRTDLKTDQGEREAISLALELSAEIVLIDDRKGAQRQFALDFASPAPLACSSKVFDVPYSIPMPSFTGLKLRMPA